MQTRAAAALARWLKTHNRTQAWLAGKIGKSQSSVAEYLRGTEPAASIAAKIQTITGIKPSWWDKATAKSTAA